LALFFSNVVTVCPWQRLPVSVFTMSWRVFLGIVLSCGIPSCLCRAPFVCGFAAFCIQRLVFFILFIPL
jgi:hypothetical protein